MTGVKQANPDELQLIEGLDLYAGDDASFLRTLELGGAGVISVASHIVGDEMRRMVDEPESRAEIDASLQDVYETLFLTSNPTCTKAALNLLGHDAGGLRLPLVGADEESGGAGDAGTPRPARRHARVTCDTAKRAPASSAPDPGGWLTCAYFRSAGSARSART